VSQAQLARDLGLPDGKRLLIGSDRAGNHDVWLASRDRRDLVRLTSDPAPEWGPRWSPDGKTILFYSHRTGWQC
jgi:Tol biopolymer transport system component